jgi:replicative DNA helicase
MNTAFSVNLEKMFFTYIIQNKKYFDWVKPNFFKNTDIRKVYDILRIHMDLNPGIEVPSKKQIVEMVLLEDKDKTISKEMLKTILKNDLSGLDEETFIKPKIKTWITINNIEEFTIDIVDEARNLSTITDLDAADEMASRLRDMAIKSTNTNFSDEDNDLGTDFDIAEEHSQDYSQVKVKTGWQSLDTMLNGGWDRSTLSILMGETSIGKCCFFSDIYIRNKKTNKIEKIKIQDFFEKMKNKK